MDKKLSIIIPLYNVESYVHRAAESIAAQAFDGLEVILIDDGSTDQSADVFIKHAPDVDITLIQQKNAGQSVARNVGIHATAGEYILFLDADDFLLPEALKNILASLTIKNPDIIFGRYICWSPSTGFSQAAPYSYQPPGNKKQRTEYILSALPEPSWNVWRYICRREMLIKQNLFFEPGMLCEDVPWVLALLESADTIEFLPEPFYAYFQWRPDSTMNRMNPKRIIDLNYLTCGLLEKYKDRPIICKQLVWQSFFYINEYCAFGKQDRKLIQKSYREVMPLYKRSSSWLHQFIGQCRHPIAIYWLSVGMFAAKCIRRRWKYSLIVKN